MNVGDLKRMLERYPDDMEIIHSMYSDYWPVEEEDWSIVKAVYQSGANFLMRSHPTMSEENKAKEKEYLHLTGN